MIDEGLVLFFPRPHSYTGDDVVELQGHGGPMVMRNLLGRALELGARLAEPGEFTRRAYLNNRIDLAQAEGVADLIDAASTEAAMAAARSLSGEFSRRIHELVAGLTELRMHIEACIDFPEEDITPGDRAWQVQRLQSLRGALETLLGEARQGLVLREGLTVVLAGRPNVGKSSLLNRLAGEDVAIVTPIAGTTRDYVRATITLEGVPIHLVDTAGLRETDDPVERIGVERTWEAIATAGAALLLVDARDGVANDVELAARFPSGIPLAIVANKQDLVLEPSDSTLDTTGRLLRVSAKTGAGVDELRAWLLEVAGWRPHGEGLFAARARHVAALEKARSALTDAAGASQAFEIVAESLSISQRSLGEVTGEVTPDQLLGEIFSRFCIGK